MGLGGRFHLVLLTLALQFQSAQPSVSSGGLIVGQVIDVGSKRASGGRGGGARRTTRPQRAAATACADR